MLKNTFILLFLISASLQTAARIQVHGHRGAAGEMPENTLAAMKHAIKIGVDALELDLAVTKDNHLVLSHDPYINKDLCLKNGKAIPAKIEIHRLSLKEVLKYDCGSKRSPKFPNQKLIPGEKIPTLESLFKLTKKLGAKDIIFNIETKIYPHFPELAPTPKKFTTLIMKIIKKYKMEERVIIQSFDHRTLNWVKKLSKKVKTSQLTFYSFPNLVAVAKGSRADYSSPHHDWLTKESVQELQKHKIKVVPWTANTEKDWRKLKDYGVDAIITDYPSKLIDFLNR